MRSFLFINMTTRAYSDGPRLFNLMSSMALHAEAFGKDMPALKFESCPQTVEKIGKTDELMYNPVRAHDITWNFEKFLIDRKGRPRFRFHPTAWSHGDVIQPFINQLMNESP
uniref:Glutathione peroxidase n=1 Tax=Angiostrongylus cantonensis TaxID=6313 RepID=A0A0K0D819_ANGCA